MKGMANFVEARDDLVVFEEAGQGVGGRRKVGH